MPDADPLDIAAKSARLQQTITELEAEAVSEGGAVRVTAGAGGNVREIDLRWQAFDLEAAELGPIVAETVRAAEQAANAKVQSAVGSILGDQIPNLAARAENDS